MKKLLLLGLLLVFVFVVTAGAGLFFFGSQIISGIIRSAIVEHGPTLTGTPVALDELELSIFDGSGRIAGFAIDNPAGFTPGKAIAVGEAAVAFDLDAAFEAATGESVVFVVDRIYVDQAQLDFQRNLQHSNFDVLLANIQNALPAVESAPAENTESDASPEMKFILREIVFSNARVQGKVLGVAGSAELPTLTLTDIGLAQGGVTPAQAALEVMQQVIAAAGSALVSQNGGLQNLSANLMSAEGRAGLADSISDRLDLKSIANSLNLELDEDAQSGFDGAKSLLNALTRDEEKSDEETQPTEPGGA